MGASEDDPASQPARADGAAAPADARFDTLEAIGTGGVGTVYRGHQSDLDRPVAIKEIEGVFEVFAEVRREDIVDRFVDVARAHSRLSHPNILEIYELVSSVEHPYLVEEYAPNGNLRRLVELDDDERSLTTVMKYLVQILHGLRAAHREGTVHGGLKPENVVLDDTGNAKLTDFGMTTLVDLSGISDQVHVGMGDMAYASPEQIQDPTAASRQGDIYSLGILFYELLTGKVPSRRSPMPSSFYPSIPRQLDDIFDRMSMDDPDDRFDSLDEVLEAFYSAEPIIDLLDRQTGVVFLADPIEEGDTQFVDEDQLDLSDDSAGTEARAAEEETAPAASGDPVDRSTTHADSGASTQGAPDPEAAPAADEVREKLDEYEGLFD